MTNNDFCRVSDLRAMFAEHGKIPPFGSELVQRLLVGTNQFRNHLKGFALYREAVTQELFEWSLA